MNLNAKVTFFFISIFSGLLAVLLAISLYAFRTFSIASATDHIRTAGEIVRVHLTESMINGVIDKREAIRADPPDILLTNYKMLDFLLLRNEDLELWAGNDPDTLQYVVLDEFHTYDGAQGQIVEQVPAWIVAPK